MVLFIAVAFLPESPVWLMSKKKVEKANRSREWLMLEKPIQTDEISNQHKNDVER